MSRFTEQRVHTWVHPFLLSVLLISASSGTHAQGSPARAEHAVRAALELDRDAKRGATLYGRYCANCHGAEAAGDAARFIPALAGQRQAYVIKQLAEFTELGRESKDMHDVVSKPALSEPQTWANIAAYVNGLSMAATQEVGDGRGLSFGEAIFREQCSSCHEEDAHGDDDGFVPSLRGQNYSYLVRQMRSIAASHRTGVEPDLARFFDSLETDEITSVADYLSRLRGKIRDRKTMRPDGTVGD